MFPFNWNRELTGRGQAIQFPYQIVKTHQNHRGDPAGVAQQSFVFKGELVEARTRGVCVAQPRLSACGESICSKLDFQAAVHQELLPQYRGSEEGTLQNLAHVPLIKPSPLGDRSPAPNLSSDNPLVPLARSGNYFQERGNRVRSYLTSRVQRRPLRFRVRFPASAPYAGCSW